MLLVVVEVDNTTVDVMPWIEALANRCDPLTKAVVIGRVNDVNLYRRLTAMGVPAQTWLSYAATRWGPGWKLNPQGRQRAFGELERFRNDPKGYADKVNAELQQVAS